MLVGNSDFKKETKLYFFHFFDFLQRSPAKRFDKMGRKKVSMLVCAHMLTMLQTASTGISRCLFLMYASAEYECVLVRALASVRCLYILPRLIQAFRV